MIRSRREVEVQENEISDLVVYQMDSISIRPLLTVVAVVLYLTHTQEALLFFGSFVFCMFYQSSFYSSQVRSCSVQNISVKLTFLVAETIQPSNAFLDEVR